MGENHTTPGEARAQGRDAALAGREIWINPHIGVDAEAWFAGYRAVPDEERGSRPDLRPTPTTVRRRKKSGRPIGCVRMADAGVTALGARTLPNSTPFQDAILAEVEEARARTPKPWAEGAGL